MVIAHNLTAMNAQRQFSISCLSKKKTTEKLSSGYKINRAADDAAGLTISEKMRLQIRGLNQGSDNIQDGISLVQVAEGALNEITDMLHRVTELSIKAYNDTNTRADREAIQAEIDQLISEVDRVSDTTTFNEIPLLKGNPTIEKVTHYVSTEPHKESIYDTCKAPEWLTNASNNRATGTVTIGDKDIMLQTVVSADNKTAIDGTGDGLTCTGSYYCGPKQDPAIIEVDGIKYAWKDNWSTDLIDKSSVNISFSGLTQDVTTADALYDKLLELAGSAMSVPCATCSFTTLGVSFSAKTDSFEIMPSYTKNIYGDRLSYAGNIDLSNMLSKIDELSNKHYESKTMTEAEKKTETEALAKDIAKQIKDSVIEKIGNTSEHFDRAFSSGEYSIAIYDFRDNNELGIKNEADKLLKVDYSAYSKITFEKYSEWDEYSYSNPGIDIACSSNTPYGDNIHINLPNATAGAIGVTGYSVARYDDTIEKTYSPEYEKKMEQYDKSYKEYLKEHQRWASTAHEVETGETHKVKEITYPNKRTYTETEYNKGERRRVTKTDLGEPVEKEVEVKNKKIVYDYDEPMPPELPEAKPGDVTVHITSIYEPDDLEIINRARDYIVAQRSDLGAIQNRLEHSYNNNMNKAENTQAAESRIRDTDMATEMVNYTKLNILEQAITSMMSQANQSTQGVMSLLM